MTIVSVLSYTCRRSSGIPVFPGLPGYESRPVAVCQESSRAANSLLCSRRGCRFRSSLPGRADDSNSETADPAERQAGAGPKPALRYRLLPELKEMNPGNPIQHYMKCMMEQKKFFFDEEAFQNREKLLTMPLKELPARELKDYGRLRAESGRLGRPARQSRLADPAEAEGRGIELLLPEVQQIRSLARALQVRFRAEIAQGRFDDAIRTAKTMFAISRHLGEHPTLIGDLVGMAIASLAISPLEEMLEQAGLPQPLLGADEPAQPPGSLDKGMDGERVMMAWVFRDLNEGAPMSKDQLNKFIADRETARSRRPEKPACGRGWTPGPRTKRWSVPPATPRRIRPPGGAG